VLRRSIRPRATGERWSNRPDSIALTGRWSIRLETLADSRISRSPMVVTELTLPLKSGDWTSTLSSESANASACCSSCPTTPGSTGTTVLALAGSTAATGAGGTSTSSAPTGATAAALGGGLAGGSVGVCGVSVTRGS
jgi:hypothetical protein